jgi:hypothetical protein
MSPLGEDHMLTQGHFAALGLLSVLGTSPLVAQSVLSGIVREDSSGRALSLVEVVIEGSGLKAVTGLNGRYVIEAVPAGRRMVMFRLVGYLPTRFEVLLTPGDTTRANVVLIRSVMRLDSIIVRAEPSRPRGEGREGFEERRRLGFGRFYDTVDLRRSEHLQLRDLLRRKGGVTVELSLVDGVRRPVAYNPHRLGPGGRPNCVMQVYFNGTKFGSGGRFTDNPPDLGMFDVSSLDAIEVYPNAAQVPGIYSGPTAACGVILLWSRQR